MTSCCSWCPPDPGDVNHAAYTPADKWTGAKLSAEIFPNDRLLIPEDNEELSLTELMNIALNNNPITYQTWADARAAAFNWGAAKSALYPSVDLQETLNFVVQHGRRNNFTNSSGTTITPGAPVDTTVGNTTVSNSDPNSISVPGYTKQFISNLSISYLLFDFGGREANILAMEQALLYANWTHNQSLQDVMLTTIQAYYNYLTAKALVEAKKADQKNSEADLAAAKAQFEAGVNSIVDVLQAEANLANTMLQLVQYQGQTKIYMGQLAAALGLPANTVIPVKSLPEIFPTELVSKGVDELFEIAKSQRADLAATFAAYTQRIAEWRVARSAGMPTVTTNVDIERFGVINAPQLNRRIYTGSIVLDIPIFSGFYFLNQQRSALAEVESFYAQMRSKEDAVLLDVFTAYYQYYTAVETLKYSKEYLKFAEEAYKAAYANYTEGAGTMLDLLAAQSVLSNARSQVIEAKTQWATSLANISYATGVLSP